MTASSCRYTGICLLALTLSACLPNKMYRPDNIDPGPDYTLTYLEFDDQGEMWSPDQLARILREINEANESETGALVMLFIVLTGVYGYSTFLNISG